MIDAHRVRRRLDLVGDNTGSIVALASWCALHATAADVVLGCVAERLLARDTDDAARAALVYVVHELLVTCASRGVSDAGRRAVLLAVNARVRPALVTLLSRSGHGTGDHNMATATVVPHGNDAGASSFAVTHAQFLRACDKVLRWWALLGLFPSAWLDELRRLCDAQQQLATPHRRRHRPDSHSSNNDNDNDDDGSNASQTLTGALQQLTAAMTRYSACKERWQRARALKRELDAGDDVAAAARAMALRALDDVAALCESAHDANDSRSGTAAAAQVVDAAAMARWVAVERGVLGGVHGGNNDDGGSNKSKSADVKHEGDSDDDGDEARCAHERKADVAVTTVTRNDDATSAVDSHADDKSNNDADGDDEDDDVLASFY